MVRADRLEPMSWLSIEVDGRLTTVIITEIEPDPFADSGGRAAGDVRDLRRRPARRSDSVSTTLGAGRAGPDSALEDALDYLVILCTSFLVICHRWVVDEEGSRSGDDTTATAPAPAGPREHRATSAGNRHDRATAAWAGPCAGDPTRWDLDVGTLTQWLAAMRECVNCPVLDECVALRDEFFPDVDSHPSHHRQSRAE